MSDELDLRAHFPMQEGLEDFGSRQREFSIECHFKVKVNWQFTTTDARTKRKRLYPTLDA